MSESISMLPDEPEESNPNATTINFRSPDGSTTFTRRFLKTHRIRSLYDYIISLGVDAGFENDHSDFELMQNFPKQIYDDMNQTLEAAGLFPRSKIIIHEKEPGFDD
jgi:hypothetical protein